MVKTTHPNDGPSGGNAGQENDLGSTRRRGHKNGNGNGKGREAADADALTAPVLAEEPEVPAQVKLSKVKLGTRHMKVQDYINLGEANKTAMVNNPNYPVAEQQPAPLVFDAALSELKTRHKKVESLKNQMANAREQEERAQEAFHNQLILRAAYVEQASKGDKSKILSARLDVARKGHRVEELARPVNVAVTPSTTVSGKATVSWKAVPHAKSYLVQVSPAQTVERQWVRVEPSTRSKLDISGLVPLERHAFRVCAVGGRTGRSDWSAEFVQTIL